MKYKYQLLKTSWGIVIYLDIDEILDCSPLEIDVLIAQGIYLRLDDSIQWYTREVSLKYISAGLRDLAEIIRERIGNSSVCFYIKNIDFNEADFQEEGLYCAIQEWISKYYNLTIKPIIAEFDKEQNKYIFSFRD